MKLKELKNGWENNGSFIPNDENNNDYQLIKKYIADGGIYEKFDWLQDAKETKIAQLKINLDNESKKPFNLNGVKQIDKEGKVIKTVNAYYNIENANSLTDPKDIVFAGLIMKTQAFLKILCLALGKDFDALKNQVNALSDNSTTASIANIPYTTKDSEGKEIRVLLSFQKLEEIFVHIFNRVAKKNNAFNIIEEQIKKATSIEELDKINITLNDI